MSRTRVPEIGQTSSSSERGRRELLVGVQRRSLPAVQRRETPVCRGLRPVLVPAGVESISTGEHLWRVICSTSTILSKFHSIYLSTVYESFIDCYSLGCSRLGSYIQCRRGAWTGRTRRYTFYTGTRGRSRW